MVTRKSHSRKEKKAMATFGQFILPLTVVMAAALMFFSVKLFFLDPHDVKITDNANVSTNKSYSEPVPQHTDDEIEKLIKEQDSPKKTTVKEPVVQSTKKKKTVDSQNKDVIKSEQKRTEQKQTEPPKTKPVQIVVKKTVKSADVSDNRQKQTAPESKSAARWDVQIGGFAAKSGALETLQKARSEGYSVYLTESTMNEKPFYKVRVRGFSEKKDAAKLASEMETKGYPVYLVYNK